MMGLEFVDLKLTEEDMQKLVIEYRKEFVDALKAKFYNGDFMFGALALSEFMEVCFHIARKSLDTLIDQGILHKPVFESANESINWETRAIFDIAMALFMKLSEYTSVWFHARHDRSE